MSNLVPSTSDCSDFRLKWVHGACNFSGTYFACMWAASPCRYVMSWSVPCLCNVFLKNLLAYQEALHNTSRLKLFRSLQYTLILPVRLRRSNESYISRSTDNRFGIRFDSIFHYKQLTIFHVNVFMSLIIYPRNRPWRSVGLWDDKNPTLSR
jgi:hypothetical protein